MGWVVGIDEVGRGALAGPVVVAAAAFEGGRTPKGGAPGRLRDSKKLTAARREEWFSFFCGVRRGESRKAAFATARVYPRGIERMNISKAANLAAERAFLRLAEELGLGSGTRVFLDGGLFLGNGKLRARMAGSARTVVRGDEKIAAVAAASIVAKVSRDRFMRRLAARWPAYGFDVHKGYGTVAHVRAIKKHGPCPVHRLTFLGESVNIRRHGRSTGKTSH